MLSTLFTLAMLIALVAPTQAQQEDRNLKESTVQKLVQHTMYISTVTHHKIQQVQESLQELGYKPGPIDGIMGNKTRAAIRAFQENMDLPITGEVSSELLRQLARAASSSQNAEPKELHPENILNPISINSADSAVKNVPPDAESQRGKSRSLSDELPVNHQDSKPASVTSVDPTAAPVFPDVESQRDKSISIATSHAEDYGQDSVPVGSPDLATKVVPSDLKSHRANPLSITRSLDEDPKSKFSPVNGSASTPRSDTYPFVFNEFLEYLRQNSVGTAEQKRLLTTLLAYLEEFQNEQGGSTKRFGLTAEGTDEQSRLLTVLRAFLRDFRQDPLNTIKRNGLMVLILSGVFMLLLYSIIIHPIRKRAPLRKALAIIRRDEDKEFHHAVPLLNTALTSGLSKKDIRETRFALAYVQARLGKYTEAATVLDGMETDGKMEKGSLYLSLWLGSKLNHHEKVEQLYSEHTTRLGDLLDTKLIVSIAYLNRAKDLWSRKKINGALHYFEQLRRLDVLTEEIPKNVENHQLVIGIIELFQNQIETARSHFKKALEIIDDETPLQQHAKLGLLLCDWKDQRLSRFPEIDQKLEETIDTLAKNHPGPQQSDLPESKQDGANAEQELDDETKLLRNCLLWHAYLLICIWQGRLRPKSELPSDEHKHFIERIERVIDLDPNMGDPYLLEGLLNYYFSTDDIELRQKAIKQLKLAIENGVNLPEVLSLYNRELRLAELEKDADKEFIKLTRGHLRNPQVSNKARSDLKQRLRFFKGLGTEVERIETSGGIEDPLPVSHEVQTRSRTLQRRLQRLTKSQINIINSRDLERLSKIFKELEAKQADVVGLMKGYEKVENDALVSTAEVLLPEEN